MKVVIGNHTVFIGWRYDNKQNPTVTSCIVKNTEKEVISEVTIRKHVNDRQMGRDAARRLSLSKLLFAMFPGKEHKDTREIFWKAYLERNNVPKKTTLTVAHVNEEK